MSSAFKLLFLKLQNYRRKNPEVLFHPDRRSCGIILGDPNTIIYTITKGGEEKKIITKNI